MSTLAFDIGSSWSADANLKEGQLFLGHRQAALTPNITPLKPLFKYIKFCKCVIFLTTSLPICGDKSCPVKAVLRAILCVPIFPG